MQKIFRGIIHFHSNFSFDSNITVGELISFAEEYDINFFALTDHDTIEGSLALKREVERKKANIEVIIGAEYYTNIGDVIALFITKEIKKYYNFYDLVKDVKEQDGLIFLPHPYRWHTNLDEIVSFIDRIEIFNISHSDELDRKAAIFANKYNKNVYYGNDAHSIEDLPNSIVEISGNVSLKESLKNGDMKQIRKKRMIRYE